MNELHLFAGAGGGILGGIICGHTCVCAVEIEPFCREILLQRQRDGMLPKFPIWDDIRTFDGRPWRGLVDIVAGGFPCQDISGCGKGAGIDGERSGLWREMARVIGEVRPRFVFVENSPMLISRGLGAVLADLSKVGPYECRWGVVGADDCSAPHIRKRFWLVGVLAEAFIRRLEGHARDGAGRREPGRNGQEQDGYVATCGMGAGAEDVANPASDGRRSGLRENGTRKTDRAERKPQPGNGGCAGWWRRAWPAEPAIPRMAYGVAHRLDREKATGNGQVPRVAAAAWEILTTMDESQNE